MNLLATEVHGAFVIDLDRKADERGFFARTWCRSTLSGAGLDANLDQTSVSFNARAGTLRGMHFQRAPHAETKLVRCTMGAVFDVVLDLRPDSPSYLAWHGVELSAENRRSLYVPKGCAHGFITLADASEVLYMISDPYVPESAAGARWDDPTFGIDWPVPVRVIAERDRTYPDWPPAGSDVREGSGDTP